MKGISQYARRQLATRIGVCLLLLLGAIATIATLTPEVIAAPTGEAVSGVVTWNGNPRAGALVEVELADHYDQTYTDANGSYRFNLPFSGWATVIAEGPSGYDYEDVFIPLNTHVGGVNFNF